MARVKYIILSLLIAAIAFSYERGVVKIDRKEHKVNFEVDLSRIPVPNFLVKQTEFPIKVYHNGNAYNYVDYNVTWYYTSTFSSVKFLIGQAYNTAAGRAQKSGEVTLWTESGEQVVTLADLQKHKDELYITFHPELFYYPAKPKGTKIPVNIDGGKTLTIESISNDERNVPHAFLVPNFLSEEEADWIIGNVTQEMTRSTVLENDQRVESKTRTSSTTYVLYPQWLIDRSFSVTKHPRDNTFLFPDHQLQVIHYGPTQFFHPHNDAFEHSPGLESWFFNGKRNRFATLFVYLNTVESGGETAFINHTEYMSKFRINEYHIDTNNPCTNYATGKVTARKGDALLFYNLNVDGHLQGAIDPNSLHTGCAVKSGEKWACNIWFYNRDHHGDAKADDIMRASRIKE
eukprot:TRINITY_DN2912_c0_g1_i1.p1 TRINITY_DN2912_c0_g1~~TRINITY_DN2912_c0_g1_i1.p1  ORF type:complete len:412 (-),score=68.48 TRINITY_DN2912_c0_g1_i1:60-1268(-)